MPQGHTPLAAAAGLTLLALAGPTPAAELGYYSQPALHGNTLIFVSEGDLWTAALPQTIDGNAQIIAHRLTSSDGDESHPVISPDGSMVAFSAQYDGNTDVYIMPTSGGAPRRLTFHPYPDAPLAWHRDGRGVYFKSPRDNPLGRTELYSIDLRGGMPTRHTFGECSQLAVSSTGRRFLFTRWSNENWTWKRYRGGTAPEIWSGNFSNETFTQLTDDPASDLFPMWVIGRAFFLSDRSGTANIYSDDGAGGDLKQHTMFTRDDANPTTIDGYDIRWPSADAQLQGRRIVFTQGAGLALLEVTTNQVTRLNVQLASDRIASRQRFADLKESITGFDLSHDGKTLLVESRGEIISIDIETGEPRQLTRLSGAREWGASFLNEDQVVLISDEPGEQQLAQVPADASSGVAFLTQGREGWMFPPVVSPDGNFLAFADNTMRLHLLNMLTLGVQLVDTAGGGEIRDYRFSPDSQWLAYTKPLENMYASVSIHSLRTGRSFSVSDPMHFDHSPRWDPAGKYLFFLSERHFDPVMDGFDYEHVYPRSTRFVVLPLTEGTPPPVPALARAAGFDLEQWAKGEDQAPADRAPAGGDADNAAVIEPVDPLIEQAPPVEFPPMRVDTDNLVARQFVLPVPPGDYANLEIAGGSLYFVEVPVSGLLGGDEGGPSGSLRQYNLVEAEPGTVLEGTDGFAMSRDGSTIAAFHDDAFNIVTVASGEQKPLGLGGATVRLDVPAEWNQIFHEAWRLQRDFYWAPNMVGVNWDAMQARYEALLPRIGTRTELNDLIGQLIGELGTSHTYIWGGEQHDQVKPISIGLLGIDVISEAGGVKITRVLPEPGWSTGGQSPLAAAHLGVSEGNFITAINGQTLNALGNLHDLMQNSAGKKVRLTIADDAAGTNARTIESTPIPSDQSLRYEAWVATNRAHVSEMSEGRVGYIHIPNMGGDGLQAFSRQFFPQSNMSALIIDVRNNGGGFVSQMIIDRLAAGVYAYMQPRHGAKMRYPQRGVSAHMVGLIDQHAGSDGDIFPAMFQSLGLGPLIGTRTWGGVVGIRGDKPFVDMGLSTQPEYAWWDAAAGWSIENQGVSPDIEVDITPSDRMRGADPQLDRGVAELLKMLEDDPKMLPQHPPYPIRD